MGHVECIRVVLLRPSNGWRKNTSDPTMVNSSKFECLNTRVRHMCGVVCSTRD